MIYLNGRSIALPMFAFSLLIVVLFFIQRDEPLCNYLDTHVRRFSHNHVMQDLENNRYAKQLSEKLQQQKPDLRPAKDNLYGAHRVHSHVQVAFKNDAGRYYSPFERSLTFTNVSLKLLLKGVLGL